MINFNEVRVSSFFSRVNADEHLDGDSPSHSQANLGAGQIAAIVTSIKKALKKNEYKELAAYESDILACVGEESCFEISDSGEITRIEEATLQDLLEHVGKEKAPIVLLLLEEHKLRPLHNEALALCG